MLFFFPFFFYIRCRRAVRPASPLSRAGREIARRVPQIVHPAAEKFQRRAPPRRAVLAVLPRGALTCIMRYRAFAVRGMFSTWPVSTGSRRCYALGGLVRGEGLPPRNSRGERVLREARRARVASRYCSCTSARIAYTPLMPAVAVVHMHYPIIVAMTKVSRANRARAAARWYAFASGYQAAHKFSKHHYARDSVTNVRPRGLLIKKIRQPARVV